LLVYNQNLGVKNQYNDQVDFVLELNRKHIFCVGKILELTRKKGETVWLQCDVNEHLRSSIEWRWNGRNIQETLFNNFLLTKEQSKYLVFSFVLIRNYFRFNYY
jgi:hypothetical protein